MYSHDSGDLRVYFYPTHTSTPLATYLLSVGCMTPAIAPLSAPHSAAFVDLDGDCMPDLFLTKQTPAGPIYEIYIQKIVSGKQMYCMVCTDDLPVDKDGKIAMIEFADIDRNAMVDMLFVLDQQIFTFYNMYSANSANDDSLCKSPSDTVYLQSNPIFAKFANIAKGETKVISRTLTI